MFLVIIPIPLWVNLLIKAVIHMNITNMPARGWSALLARLAAGGGKKLIILLFLSIFVLTGASCVQQNGGEEVTILTIEEAKAAAESFINANLMPAGQTATVKEVVEEGGLYKAVVSAGTGEDINSYMTKDGKTFFPQGMDMKNTDPAGNQEENAQPTVKQVPEITESDIAKGKTDSKVAVIEYSDFECPFCLRHNATMDKLYEEYKDKIAFYFRHFPLSFHPEAQKAAEASECAGEQGKFWEMHDAIFAANEEKNMSVAKWKTAAKTLGLNSAQFDKCLDDGKYAGKVASDMAGGKTAGVSGTPATFVNGQVFSGAVDINKIKAAIDSALASAQE